MIGPGALHPVPPILDAAPEVAAAHYNPHLDASLTAFLDHIADSADHIEVQAAAGIAGQCLSADFQQDSFILRFRHSEISPSLFL